MEKARKSPINRLFSSQIFLTILGLGVLIILSFPLAKNISQRHKIDNEVKQMQDEINRIEKKNSGLRNLVSYLQSDQFAESEARLKLGLKKKGEEVTGIKTLNPAEDDSQAAPQSVFNLPGLDNSEPERAETNPERWIKYFFE